MPPKLINPIGIEAKFLISWYLSPAIRIDSCLGNVRPFDMQPAVLIVFTNRLVQRQRQAVAHKRAAVSRPETMFNGRLQAESEICRCASRRRSISALICSSFMLFLE